MPIRGGLAVAEGGMLFEAGTATLAWSHSHLPLETQVNVVDWTA